ncbi:MAG: transcription elongation factor 1 family protein [Promethearchaeota archaeon]
MGRRKRKQQSYKRVKRVPKIFTCPNCGEKSVKVENIRKSAIATVKCGHCGLNKDVIVNSISEPVDAFGDFIDIYYADQELQRLERRIPKLKKGDEWGELALSYSILSDICRAKAVEALEEEVDTLELEKGIKTDEESLFDETEGKVKREKKIEDIFDDPGFLEF